VVDMAAVPGAAAQAGPEPLSPGAMVWHRFRRHRLALFGGAVLLLLAVVAVFAPWIAPYNPYHPFSLGPYALDSLAAPSATHPLGTDVLGRDVLSRLIYAGRVSLTVGILAVLIAVAIAVLVGSTAGYYGGWVDNVLMRVTDTVITFPALFLVMILTALLHPSIWNVILVIGFVNWTGIARLVRGEFLRLIRQEFVTAARGLGARPSRIIWRHLLPNSLGPVIVAGTFGMADAILIEAALSFLGVGVQQPVASWGNMLSAATDIAILLTRPMLWLAPGAAIVLTVLSINFVGDGLRDALDPHVGRRS
jgi:peptide/nickel transport system permease protein